MKKRGIGQQLVIIKIPLFFQLRKQRVNFNIPSWVVVLWLELPFSPPRLELELD